ncbi:hypothetical protein P7K49_029946 [Saguinus oedipus]|uniref:Uncharacterized protein n=1 Tax=Saguinus oedipus TaxID=9490 RepID=A0ABQ9U8N9_SAGOE|nr:hypothetical protein P7K49_029946 [Saguinus oedipus]
MIGNPQLFCPHSDTLKDMVPGAAPADSGDRMAPCLGCALGRSFCCEAVMPHAVPVAFQSTVKSRQ